MPTTNLPLNQTEIENMQSLIDPLQDSKYHGVNIYMEVLNYFESRIVA